VVQSVEERPIAETLFVPILVQTATLAASLSEGQKLGAKLHSDLRLEDPAPQVTDRLAHFLQTSYNASIRRSSLSPASDEIEALRESFGTATVLDVRTTSWGIFNNHPRFVGRARLMRLGDSSVIWEAACEQAVPPRAARGDENAMATLLANNGEALKAKLQHRVDSCTEQLTVLLAAARITPLRPMTENRRRAPLFGPDAKRFERGADTGGNVRFESEDAGDGRCSSWAACGGREPREANRTPTSR
jgi:hypothetical protein